MIFLNAYTMYVWMNFLMRKYIYEILDFFLLKIHLWMHDFCLECIYNVCLNDFILFMRKCIYEILDFLFLKMHLWMYDFFWNAYIMYVLMILFYLWENAFMKFWTFCFWKCIYECMIFFWNDFGSFFNMDACIIFFRIYIWCTKFQKNA